MTEGSRRPPTHDPLTGCYNRRFAFEVLETLIKQAQLRPMIFGVSLFDVDQFKLMYGRFGHIVGDTVLKEIGRVLTDSHSQECSVCRIGGDEFLAIASELFSRPGLIDGAKTATRLVKRIPDRMTQISDVPLSLSVGISFYPNDGHSIEELLMAAEGAVYEAKRQGGDRVILAYRDTA